MSLIHQTLISALAEYSPGPGWFLAGIQAPAAPASHAMFSFLRARALSLQWLIVKFQNLVLKLA